MIEGSNYTYVSDACKITTETIKYNYSNISA